MSVRTFKSGVKNGRAPGGTASVFAASFQKPLSGSRTAAVELPARGTRQHAAGGKEAVALGDTNGHPGSLPGLLVERPHVNGAAKAGVRLRPQQPMLVNTLTVDDDDEPGEAGGDVEPSPDFVGSKYQRTVGDEQPGTFCPDWVVLVTGSNKAEFLVLAQIAYWFALSKRGKLKVTEFWNGCYWLYKTYGQLAKDLRGSLTPDEVRWAVRSLEGTGILITDYDPARRKPKLYRIDPAVVAAKEEAAERRLAAATRKNRREEHDDEERA